MVLIHDGVRPLIDAQLISENIESVLAHGSGITCTKFNETVVSSEAQHIDEVIPRDHIYAAQAPQSFRLGEILALYDRAVAESELDTIDSCSLMHRYGMKIYRVDGPRSEHQDHHSRGLLPVPDVLRDHREPPDRGYLTDARCRRAPVVATGSATRSSTATCRGIGSPAPRCSSPAPAGCCRHMSSIPCSALNDRARRRISVHGLVRNEDEGPAVARRRARPSRLPSGRPGRERRWRWSGPLDYVVHGASAARPVLHGTEPVATIKANLLGTLQPARPGRAKREPRIRPDVLGRGIRSAATPAPTLIERAELWRVRHPQPPRLLRRGQARARRRSAPRTRRSLASNAGVARFGHVYGPGMALDDGRVQADFAANVSPAQDIVLNSDGSAVRTYTYVADAIAGLFYALLRGDRDGLQHRRPRWIGVDPAAGRAVHPGAPREEPAVGVHQRVRRPVVQPGHAPGA